MCLLLYSARKNSYHHMSKATISTPQYNRVEKIFTRAENREYYFDTREEIYFAQQGWTIPIFHIKQKWKISLLQYFRVKKGLQFFIFILSPLPLSEKLVPYIPLLTLMVIHTRRPSKTLYLERSRHGSWAVWCLLKTCNVDYIDQRDWSAFFPRDDEEVRLLLMTMMR